ncbi:hypothetical protein B5F07_07350 [Lachnoclostridium sp. An169]|uniref:GNAT family N-acetyltransferase n=1 Tax=Lachnoclostridium sp. An169 TaxID=1965569 RepID=UPI000B36EC2E|nr:GNAT family N-acetyltransferase [Lachnoclostridium sp. An169]OUP84635.1 hypothetical protein B5F07_07350 [Lachnoclostridium sp. An169]HJA66134.1 GNAT family N-acetyltransferase [Candidatus Mediterraneibacter cottocaccae]
MLKKCGNRDEQMLTEYLGAEKEYNTFLLADLKTYGFDSECQDVWMDWEDGRCTCVYLRFYNNLLVYSREGALNPESMEYILKNCQIFVIMGKSGLLSEMGAVFGDRYKSSSKQLYRLGTRENLCGTDRRERQQESADHEEHCSVVQAGLEDVDDIYEFLGSIPQIRGLYRSKDMIRDRIASRDGTHLIIRRGSRIVSHGNSTTGSDDTVMIGGVATDPAHRRNGYASMVVSRLAEMILEQGKIPCLFSGEGAHAFFERLGFESLGGWMTLERNSG